MFKEKKKVLSVVTTPLKKKTLPGICSKRLD